MSLNSNPARDVKHTSVVNLTPGHALSATGPDGKVHGARLIAAYLSTGGILSVWIDLRENYSANPANRQTSEWQTPVLVLTERHGIYRDLWGGQWVLQSRPGW